MSGQFRISLYDTPESDVSVRLRWIRQLYPGARITLVAPQWRRVTRAEAPYLDDVQEVPHYYHASRRPTRLAGVARVVRDTNPDLLIVMVPGIRVRLVAALSQPPRCECWYWDGRVIPLRQNLFGAMRTVIIRRLQGRLRYPLWWLITRLWRVRMPGEKNKLTQWAPWEDT